MNWTRRRLLAAGAGAAFLRARAADASVHGLRKIAEQRGLVYGCSVHSRNLEHQDFAEALVREAGCLVAETESKRHIIEAVRGSFNFGPTERLLTFAEKHRMHFRGHTLVWHERNPNWLQDALEAGPSDRILTDYIQAVVQHFRGRIGSWDVVNEAVLPEDQRSDGLRNSLWTKAFGPGYIDLAFHAARAADPGTQLVYNETHLEAASDRGNFKRQHTLRLLEGMKARGVPIDAIGIQSHLRPYEWGLDEKALAHFLREIVDLGLRVLVTELDVRDWGGPLDLAKRYQEAADITQRYLSVVMTTSRVDAIVTWGLSDRYTWLTRWKPTSSPDPAPLPLDRNMNRKPMWYAIANALSSDVSPAMWQRD